MLIKYLKVSQKLTNYKNSDCKKDRTMNSSNKKKIERISILLIFMILYNYNILFTYSHNEKNFTQPLSFTFSISLSQVK